MKRDVDTLLVYTDGSRIDGRIGSAAVCPALGVNRQAYLGTNDYASVYATELLGILIGT